MRSDRLLDATLVNPQRLPLLGCWYSRSTPERVPLVEPVPAPAPGNCVAEEYGLGVTQLTVKLDRVEPGKDGSLGEECRIWPQREPDGDANDGIRDGQRPE